MAIPITIENADIHGQGGDITGAKITGDATIQAPPSGGDAHPSHPILLPPEGEIPEDCVWLLVYCPNPPPPHWEWILFDTSATPPERPHPMPPEPPEIGGGIDEKPFPPDGGWGYKEPYGWIYWPGPGGAGPKRR